MRLIALYLASFGLVFANESLLNDNKKAQIELEKNRVEVNAQKLERDWINPLSIGVTKNFGSSFNPESETLTKSVDFSQPIFRSGGIWFAIGYAKENRSFGEFSVALQEKALEVSALKLLYNLRKIDWQIKKQELLVQNASIDVVRKTELFEQGVLDSGFLDNAILSKSMLEEALLSIKITKSELEQQFRSMSDVDYNSINIMPLSIMDKNVFLDKNLSIGQKGADYRQQEKLKQMTVSNLLPTIAVYAKYTYQEYTNPSAMEKNMASEYTSYGVSFSMPIGDINTFRKIELAKVSEKLAYQKLKDEKKNQELLYKSVAEQLKYIDKKIAQSNRDKKLYQNLQSTTKEGVENGVKTSYDLETISNSLETKKIDNYIHMIDKELLLLSLHEKVAS